MKILLLNGGKQFAHSDGRYNETLHNAALAYLDHAGHDVQTTFIDGGYDIEAEVKKYLWADVVIYQMPGWWMGAPWTVKKYIDEVFTQGHGSLYANDGRTRSDASQRYGSGGLIHDKRYMISATWNAPSKPLTTLWTSSKAGVWMRSTSPSTRPTSSSACNRCPPSWRWM